MQFKLAADFESARGRRTLRTRFTNGVQRTNDYVELLVARDYAETTNANLPGLVHKLTIFGDLL
jgi:hypothetical protein